MVAHYLLGSDLGDASAQEMLGAMHEYGMFGLTRDEGEAVRLYTLAAGQGHVKALLRLGRCHRYGWCGLEPDALRARLYLGQAAAKGCRSAAQELDSLLEALD